MTTNYVAVSPGSVYPIITLTAYDANGATVSGSLAVPAMKDITMNNSNDIFTWTQLNETGKLQIATTSTNSVACNLVLEEATYFGNVGATANSAAKLGIQGLSTNKTKCSISISHFGSKTVTANCYVTGLAPTVSADSPVWVSPCTFTVTGDYSFA